MTGLSASSYNCSYIGSLREYSVPICSSTCRLHDRITNLCVFFFSAVVGFSIILSSGRYLTMASKNVMPTDCIDALLMLLRAFLFPFFATGLSVMRQVVGLGLVLVMCQMLRYWYVFGLETLIVDYCGPSHTHGNLIVCLCFCWRDRSFHDLTENVDRYSCCDSVGCHFI